MRKLQFFILLFLLTISFANAADRVALVMGNNAYSNSPLYKARSDAKAIGDVLTSIGFDVVRSYDASRNAMDKALSQFGQKASRADIALVYYAGHAIQVDGKNYLVPANTEVKRQGDLRKLIDLNDLIIEAKQAKGLGLVLLDACRDNPFANSLSSSLGRSVRGRGLARVESTPTNVLVSFATKENNIAPDNSYYAKALLKYLPQANLEVRMLMGSIRDEVMEATGNKQQPHIYGTLGRKAWYLTNVLEKKIPKFKIDIPLQADLYSFEKNMHCTLEPLLGNTSKDLSECTTPNYQDDSLAKLKIFIKHGSKLRLKFNELTNRYAKQLYRFKEYKSSCINNNCTDINTITTTLRGLTQKLDLVETYYLKEFEPAVNLAKGKVYSAQEIERISDEADRIRKKLMESQK